MDLSKYKSLTIKIKKLTAANIKFRLYDSSNYWDEAYEFTLPKNQGEINIVLKDLKTASGKSIDLSHIRIAGFTTTATAGQALYLKEIALEADPAAVNAVEVDASAGEEGFIDLMGRPVENPSHGIFIRRSDRKKVYIP